MAIKAKLSLAEECYARAEDAGLSKRELAELARVMGKCSDDAIFTAICKLNGLHVAAFDSSDMERAIGLLYSLTDFQLGEFTWTLKSGAGWD